MRNYLRIALSVPSALAALAAMCVVCASGSAQELHRTGLLPEDITSKTTNISPAPSGPLYQLPSSIDHSSHMPPVGDQSAQGSCVAWACAYYYKTYQEWQDYGWSVGSADHIFSPAFMYNHINGGRDMGGYFSDAMKLLTDHGCATLADMPYDYANCTRWPADSVYRHAMTYRCSASYYIFTSDMNGIGQLKQHLANGNVAVLAINVYSNFDNIAAFNNIYSAHDRTGSLRGGHGVTLVGYDDAKVTADGPGAFRAVNSWGTGWGDAGYFWMSYAAVMDAHLSQRFACYTTDLIHYAPSFIGTFNISHPNRYLVTTSLGAGASASPEYSKQFFNFDILLFGTASQPFPSTNISLDLSSAADLLNRPGIQNVFLSVTSSMAGMVNHFSVTDMRSAHSDTSGDTPMPIAGNNAVECTNVGLTPVMPSILTPIAGERVKSGGSVDIVWTPARCSLLHIDYTNDDGAAWTQIASDVHTADGKFRWTIPPTPGTACRIRIRDAGTSGASIVSGGLFTIAPVGIITETEPNAEPGFATALAYTDTVDAAISPETDEDYFAFRCTAGDTLRLTGEPRGPDAVSLNIELYDDRTSYRIAHCEFLGSQQKMVVCIMPYTGTYYVKCAGDNFDNLFAHPSGAARTPSGGMRLPIDALSAAVSPEGEYRLRLERFAPCAPQLDYADVFDYDSLFVSFGVYPNASPTTCTIEYGLTDQYGNQLIIGSPVDGIAIAHMQSPGIAGLAPGTFYHYRIRMENAFGVSETPDRVFQKADPDPGWSRLILPTTNQLNAVDFIDERNGIVAGENILLKTSDGGASWTNIPIPPEAGTSIGVLEYITTEKIFIGGTSAPCISDDGGTTWTQRQIAMPTSGATSVSFFNANNGAVIPTYPFNSIVTTRDGGATWSGGGNNKYYSFASVLMLDSTTILASFTEPKSIQTGDRLGNIIKSTDGGNTYTQFRIGLNYLISCLSFADAVHGMATGWDDRGTILSSADAGSTWHEVSRNAAGESYQAVSMSGPNAAMVLTGQGRIQRTGDGGETWMPQQIGTRRYMRAMKSLPGGITWAVGDSGSCFVHDNRTFTWLSTLNVRPGSGGPGMNMSYGTSPGATDGIDAQTGELPLPPPPPAGFDVRFLLPSGDAAVRDVRRDGQDRITWIIRLQAGDGGYPLTFTWNNLLLPAGSFLLRDRVGGSIVNVDMSSRNSFTLTNPGITSLELLFSRQVSIPVAYQQGWNMVSVPVAASDMTPAALFPGASSDVFAYTDRYTSVGMLAAGAGYWVKFPEPAASTMCGSCVTGATIPLVPGWNLIGGYDRTASIAGLATIPEGLFTSPFYYYTNSYVMPDVMEPGKAYWIRSGGTGTIDLTGSLAKTRSHTPLALAPIDPAWMRVTVRDRNGAEARVYAGPRSVRLDAYALPPQAPSGVFDVRWSTDRSVETLSGTSRDLMIRGAAYPITISVTGGDVRVCDKFGGRFVNTTIANGARIVVANAGITQVELRVPEIPLAYELGRNFPNPFNPSTTIQFALPEHTVVKLVMYNQLGQRVAELLNAEMDAGWYETRWNAAHAASGVYYYELTTPAYRNVKRMILLK